MSDLLSLDDLLANEERLARESREQGYLASARGCLCETLRVGGKLNVRTYNGRATLPAEVVASVEEVADMASKAGVVNRWPDAIRAWGKDRKETWLRGALAIVEAVIDGRQDEALEIAERLHRIDYGHVMQVDLLITESRATLAEEFSDLFTREIEAGPDAARANTFYQDVYCRPCPTPTPATGDSPVLAVSNSDDEAAGKTDQYRDGTSPNGWLWRGGKRVAHFTPSERRMYELMEGKEIGARVSFETVFEQVTDSVIATDSLKTRVGDMNSKFRAACIGWELRVLRDTRQLEKVVAGTLRVRGGRPAEPGDKGRRRPRR
jgi:hypothetical protein